jgi:anti-sigma B factor antagonist
VPRVPFQIESKREGAAARLALAGELDLATVGRVEQAVDAALGEGVREIVVDMRGLEFVDSSGLRMFIVLDQRASSEGWKLGLARPPERVMSVFRVSGVESMLPFTDDRTPA